MNKIARLAFVFVLVLSIISVSNPTTVMAHDWSSPYAVPVSGDMVITSSAVSPVTLPGAVLSDDGRITPVGFPTGEKQFGGEALQVSGLSSGSASACFPFPTYRYGWRGAVYQWLNNKWVSLPTTFSNTEGKEGAPAMACAPIYYGGTYALLIGFSKALAPAASIPECTFIDKLHLQIGHMSDWPADSKAVHAIDVFPALPPGTRVDYQIMNIIPAGAMTGALSGSSTDTRDGVAPGDPYSFVPYYLDYQKFNFTGNWDDISFTLRIYTMGCYKDSSWPEPRD